MLALALIASSIAIAGCNNTPPPTSHPDEDMINAKAGASSMTGGTSTAAPDGKTIFASAGCAGCHTFAPAGSTGKIGPNLAEISKEGAAAVRTAIVDPNTDNAPGYKKGVMPTDFGTSLSKAELAAVVAFVAQTKGSNSGK